MTQPSIANHGDDVYIASTYSDNLNSSTTGINIIKKNNTGVTIWSKNLSLDGSFFVGSVKVDNFYKELIITGYFDDFNFKRLFVAILDLNGNLLRKKTFGDDLLPNTNLYGTDIVAINQNNVQDPCKEKGNYILTGFGSSSSSHTASKFGFVTSISKDLNSVNWYKKYDSGNVTSPGSNDFDSFNSIRRLTKNGQQLYLITGSGVDNNGASMATVDLIDENGNSQWGNASGVNDVIGAYNPHWNDTFGKFAIYNRYNDKIYLIGSLYQNTENGMAVIRINAATGAPEGHFYIHHHNYIATGVEWYSEINDELLVSSFTVFGSECNPGFTKSFTLLNFDSNLIDVNLETFRPNGNFYTSSYLQNDLSLDLLINPINYDNQTFYNQAYFTPKGLTNTNYYFEAVGLHQGSRGINNYGLNPIYILDAQTGCSDNCSSTSSIAANLGHHFNFSSSFENLNLFDVQIDSKNQTLIDNIYCSPARPSKKEETNEPSYSNFKNGFSIYPNPTQNYITIQADSFNDNQVYEINIVDLKGKLLMNSKLNQKSTQLDISSLASGIYIISIKNSDNRNVLNEKLIKN